MGKGPLGECSLPWRSAGGWPRRVPSSAPRRGDAHGSVEAAPIPVHSSGVGGRRVTNQIVPRVGTAYHLASHSGAYLVAAIPGRRAARTPTALVLSAECNGLKSSCVRVNRVRPAASS